MYQLQKRQTVNWQLNEFEKPDQKVASSFIPII